MSMVLAKEGRSLHRSLQWMFLQQALKAGHEMNGERMMGMVWYQVCVAGLNRKLKPGWVGEREREVRDRLTICVLVVISWEEERDGKKKKKNKRATQR